MDIVRQLREIYDSLRENTDPRMKDWPFIESPLIPGLLILAYLLFIYWGPRWMADQKPLKMQPILIVYNFSMVVFNLYIVKEFLLGGWLFDYTLGCQLVDYSSNPTAIRMSIAVWMFFVAKYIELLDTVFFILRKKDNQVTFLHVFHHGGLPLFWWWGVREVPGGFGTFHALVNAAVHVIMYFYYGLTAMGPKYQKYLWWKRYVTVFQLAQFFIVTLHNSQFLFMECAFPWKFVACIQGFTTIVASLFLNFYIKTYINPSKGKILKHAETGNGSVTNGHAHVNGYANGHATNGHTGNGYLNGNAHVVKRQ